MTGHIALRLTKIVYLPGKARKKPEPIGDLHPGWKTVFLYISYEEIQKVVDGAGFDLDIPIHVAFCDGKLRIEKERPLNFLFSEMNGDGFASLIAEFADFALPVAHF
jgi:hypothetical protein